MSTKRKQMFKNINPKKRAKTDDGYVSHSMKFQRFSNDDLSQNNFELLSSLNIHEIKYQFIYRGLFFRQNCTLQWHINELKTEILTKNIHDNLKPTCIVMYQKGLRINETPVYFNNIKTFYNVSALNDLMVDISRLQIFNIIGYLPFKHRFCAQAHWHEIKHDTYGIKCILNDTSINAFKTIMRRHGKWVQQTDSLVIVFCILEWYKNYIESVYDTIQYNINTDIGNIIFEYAFNKSSINWFVHDNILDKIKLTFVVLLKLLHDGYETEWKTWIRINVIPFISRHHKDIMLAYIEKFTSERSRLKSEIDVTPLIKMLS